MRTNAADTKKLFLTEICASTTKHTPLLRSSWCNCWAGDTLILYKSQENIENNTAEPSELLIFLLPVWANIQNGG